MLFSASIVITNPSGFEIKMDIALGMCSFPISSGFANSDVLIFTYKKVGELFWRHLIRFVVTSNETYGCKSDRCECFVLAKLMYT